MEYETGVFKRYTKNRQNGKQVTQVGVTGLSVNSKFDDDEEIILLTKDELTNLETQVQDKDKTILDLQNQINELKTELETLQNTSTEPIPEPPKYINKVLELQEEINNRNQLLFNTQNTINNIFTEVQNANSTSKDNLITLISELQTQANSLLSLTEELQTQTDNINTSFKNVGWLEWLRNKNKINIVLDMDKLTDLEAQLTEFTSQDIVQLANQVVKPMEIPTEDLDLNELYISTGNDTSNNEIVINTPDKE